MTESAPALYGIMASFADGERLVEAARRARGEGYAKVDAFAPHLVEGLEDALDLHDRKVQGTMLAGGIFGALGGFGMETYATAWHYPLNIGGRPYFSWPAYIVITFELTVLCAGLAGLAAIIFFNRLPAPYHPVFAAPSFERATRDRFFLLLAADDPRFRRDTARAFLATLNPLEIIDVET